MGSSFGVRLRSARMRQRIALSTIAERTKIKISLLEALERDDVSHWPRGIFGRSHLRAYAQAVGLNPDTVVEEFLEVHPDSDEGTPAILEAAERGGHEPLNRSPRTRFRVLIDSAIDAVQSRRHQRPLAAGRVRGIVADTAAAPTGASRETAADSSVRPHPASQSSGDTATGLIVSDDQARDQRTIADIESELTSLARLCARIGCAQELRDVAPVLAEALDLIDAVGLVLWLGDHDSGFLTPVLALGYSKNVIARLPRVPRDANNAIAAAVRSAATKIVSGSDGKTGAVAVPVVTAAGCVGALALELRPPGERRAFVCAFASIVTAQLAGLVGAFYARERSFGQTEFASW
jgi:transcriptional regulator with XRE-family HTH domain